MSEQQNEAPARTSVVTSVELTIQVSGMPDYTPPYEGAKTIAPTEVELYYWGANLERIGAKITGSLRLKGGGISAKSGLMSARPYNNLPEWVLELADRHRPVFPQVPKAWEER